MLSCRGDTICWSDGGGQFGQVRCRQGLEETSYSMNDYIIALGTGYDTCWLTMHGMASCTNDTLQGSATQIGVGETYAAQVFTSLTTYSIFSSTVAFNGTLSAGPYTVCESNSQTGYTCYATDSQLVDNSFSSYSFAFDAGTVTLGAAMFLSIHDSTLSATGLPVCGSAPCTSLTDDTGLFTLPATTSVESVVMGTQTACALYSDGTTACWGTSIPTLTGVSDICVFNGGMCGISGNTLECTGSNNFSATYFRYPTTCSSAEILWNGICIECSSVSGIVDGVCTPCEPDYYRSGTSCTLCGVGSKTNGVTCTACSPLTNYDATCTECGPGSQSFAGTCSSCTLGTFRNSETSCSTCPPGSLPSVNATTCLRCADPYALLYSTSANTFADGTCTRSPPGYYVYGASWTLCEPGTTRTGVQPYCVTCPPGTIHNASHTFCEACPDGTVRNTGGSCFSCPSGLVANAARSGCVKHNHLSIASFRYAGFAVGGFGILTTALFYTHTKLIVRLSVFTASVLILVFCALV